MKRYLLFFLIIISNDLLSQKINNQKNIFINIVNKIDLSSSFNATNNIVGDKIKKALEYKGITLKENGRYFITISFGWKSRNSLEPEIDNFKGFVLDKNYVDKVVAEFNLVKVRDLERSVNLLVENLIFKNSLVNETGKFIDIQDHFMKMNMKMWDSSRPDSHAPSGIDADHVHMKGGIMIGYKYNLSNGVGTYNHNNMLTSEEIYSYYQRDVISQKFNTHSLEMMYGVNNKLTIFSKFSFLDKETIYQSLNSGANNLKSSGFGDINLQALYSFLSKKKIKIHSNIGFVLPTGSIIKRNKINNMPYSMQIGAGHYSFLSGFTSLFQLKKFSGGFQPKYIIGLDNNSKGYSYGNRLDLNYWLASKITNFLSLSIRQTYINSKAISGEDSNLNKNLMILNNSINSGKILLNTSLGLNLTIKRGAIKNTRISFEYSIPSFKSYNGFQVGNFNDFFLNLQYSPGSHKNH